MNIFNINDSTIQKIFNENKEYINMNIIGSLNLCYLKCNQSIELCEDLTIKRIINYGNCLILEFNKSECFLDIKFNDVENNGKFNFEKMIITLPSLHSISNNNESMEIFFLFNSKVKKDETEKELHVLLSVLVSTTTDVVNDPFNKLMSQLFGDKSKIPNSDPDNNIINYITPNSSLVDSGLNQNISPLIDLESFIPNIGERSFFDFSNKNTYFRVFKTVKEISNLTYSNINAVLKPINMKKSEPLDNLTIYFHQDFDEGKEKYLTLDSIKDLDKELDTDLETDLETELEKVLENKTVEPLLCNIPTDSNDKNGGKTDPNKNNKNKSEPLDCFHTYDDAEMSNYIANPNNNTKTKNYYKHVVWFNIIVAIIVLIFYMFSADLKYISEGDFNKKYEGERSLCKNLKMSFNRRRKTISEIAKSYCTIILYLVMSITFNILLLKNSSSYKGILIRSNIVYFILVIYSIYNYIKDPDFIMNNPIIRVIIYLWNYLTCAPDRMSSRIPDRNSRGMVPSAPEENNALNNEESNNGLPSRENNAFGVDNTDLLEPPVARMIGGSHSSFSNSNRTALRSYGKFIYLLVIVAFWAYMLTDYKKMSKPYKSFAICNIVIIGIIIGFNLILKSGEIIDTFSGFTKAIYAKGLKYMFDKELPMIILGNTLPNGSGADGTGRGFGADGTGRGSDADGTGRSEENIIRDAYEGQVAGRVLDKLGESIGKKLKTIPNENTENGPRGVLGQKRENRAQGVPNNNEDNGNNIIQNILYKAAENAVDGVINSDNNNENNNNIEKILVSAFNIVPNIAMNGIDTPTTPPAAAISAAAGGGGGGGGIEESKTST